MECRAPGCSNDQLVDSHIVPAGFARWIKEQGSEPVLTITRDRTSAKNQNGMFVRDILCGLHDGQLGRELDEKVLDLSKRFTTRSVYLGEYWRVDDINPMIMVRWIVSTFWRASVSERPEWGGVDLGEFEGRAGEVAFGADISVLPELSMEVGRFRNQLHGASFEADKIVTMPWTIRYNGHVGYGMNVGGFRILMKFDALSHPQPANVFDVVRQNRLSGRWHLIEKAFDFDTMTKFVGASYRRDEAKGIKR